MYASRCEYPPIAYVTANITTAGLAFVTWLGKLSWLMLVTGVYCAEETAGLTRATIAAQTRMRVAIVSLVLTG